MLPLYNILANAVRLLLKKQIEWQAWFGRKKFTCTALSGQAEHAITINCDLTVSCNCADIYGQGIIGDLKTATLREILSGEKARGFRRALAAGRLPIINCAACACLQENPSGRTKTPRLPESLVLENTIACQLNCLSCKRDTVHALRQKPQLSLEELTSMAKSFRQMSLKRLYFYGLGEPFLSPAINEELSIIRQFNPNMEIITSTNGAALNSPEKFEAALQCDHIYFSIDGCDQHSIQKYQRGADFIQAYQAMKELLQRRSLRKKPVVEWKYVLFHWNDRPQQLNTAVELARQAGVDILSFWKTPYPAFGISWRYYLNFSYFKNFGQACWKGREIVFKKCGPGRFSS